MNCINFPKMFQGNSTIIDTHETYEKNNDTKKDPTQLCLYLLLNSEQGELFGDPEFGVRLKYFTFNQNNFVLADLLIDEIYTKITTFCPQISIDRKNIQIELQEKGKIHIRIKYIDKLDFTTNTYNLVLKMDSED